MTPRARRTLEQENEELRLRLEEAEETLRAIRSGDVDALVVEGASGPRVYALEGTNSSYRVLVETMSEGAATLARDGTILYCNRQFAEMLGRPLKQVMGGAARDLVPDEQADAFDRLFQSAWEATTKGEVRLRRADGSSLNVHLSLNALEDDGAVLCLVATDLTEQIRARELRSSEQRAVGRAAEFEALLNAVPAAVFIANDREAKHVYGNRLCYELLRLPEGAEVSKSAPQAPRNYRVLQQGVEVPPEELPVQLAAARGVEIRSRELQVVFEDGTILQLLGNATPLRDAMGTLRGAVGAFIDVTDRVRAEENRKQAEAALRESDERLRAAFAASPDAININRVLDDGDTVYVSVNDGFERLTGWSAEQVIGKTGRELSLWVDAEQRARVLECLVAGDAVQGTETRFRRRDGTVFPASLSAQTFEVNGERFLLAITRDISEQKQAEQALRDADRRKDEFLGMLSHELRNPLAPIRNSSYVLRHVDPGSEQAGRAQAVIERQTEHLARLVDDLLDVTRVARGKIELRRSRVELREVVSRAADDFRLMLEDRGVTFHARYGHAEIWADADGTRITQVVGNLLHNSAKFTRRGDEVTLSLDVVDGAAEIRVRDTGVGIDAALLPLVFDPFVQGDRTLARTEGGLGLGLALVKGITELHGGSVRVESAGRGHGTEFVVRLPATAVALAQDGTRAGAPPRQGGRRVLVVDDNADSAESLGELVRMLGHEVEVAYDGPTAVEMARAHPPEIVFCDIGLPGMSGYEVAKALRAHGSGEIQLVAVSGYAQPDDVRAAVEAGFDRHLAKPASPEDIERLLGS